MEGECSLLSKTVNDLMKANMNYQQQAQEVRLLRRLLVCPLCERNIKDAILLTCLHTFCASCLSLRYRNREWQCPTCGKAFFYSDIEGTN
ncbi:unnamed protein product [Soboliphyme baturini]|uniref:E3 ubiquitin protein ligase n=1 Tax=Soboliphyme baturini TaxID=241478 RepID=A0A183J3A9_9BILA|nr:unnamed protein product [Soboliphyme baturini]